MKLKTKSITWTVALAAALSLATPPPCAAGIPANPLTLPSGYTAGVAWAVNASGQAVGSVTGDNGDAACLWQADGTPVVLPLLDGYGSAQANAINDSGVVVGYCESEISPYYFHATAWAPDANGEYTATDLGVLEGENESAALRINAEGQVLCSSSAYGDSPWFLWENGVQTEIAMSDGTPIDASGISLFGNSGLLSSNGRVAGTVDLGYNDINGNEVYKAVLWQKTSSGSSTTDLTTGGVNDSAEAISPNGVVAGYSDADGFFLYDANTAVTTYVDTTTWTSDDGSISYTPWWILSVNDQGQALADVIVADSNTGAYAFAPWVWQSGNWTQIPLDSLFATGTQLYEALGVINNSGQVAGFALVFTTGSPTAIGFGWSASMGTVELAPPSGTDLAIAVALNDSGLAVGGGESSDYSVILPATWDLSAPSTPDISAATVSSPSPKSPNITVTVMISNSTASTAYNVTVTAASLDGVDTKSALPLVYGAIKPGAIKKCTLQFKNVSSGDQTLTINGTSSLGDFFTTQTVTVP